MAYKYDPLKYKKTFDNMFGSGEFDSGIARAKEIGTKIGEAKMLRKAMEEAAKEEKKKKEKEEKKKKSKSKKAQENENLKKRIEASGGSTEKKQSAVGKALNLNPDNNLFFDALDLYGRSLNAVMNIGKREEERKKGKSKKDKHIEEMRSKPIWETGIGGKLDVLKDQAGAAWEGFSGKEKTTGSDVLEEAGMKKGIARSAAGFGLDVVADPLNLVGGAAAKVAGKGVGLAGKGLKKIPGVEDAANFAGDIFSNKRIMRETLTKGKQTDALETLNSSLLGTRSEWMDKSLSDVAKARRTAGKTVGDKVGKVMEEPLSKMKNVDFQAAPSVINTERALNEMKPALGKATNPTSPLARFGGLETKTTASSKINLPEPTDKEVRAWLKKNDLPGADKKGRISTFNKNFYKAENEDVLRNSFHVETKIRNVLASTSDVEKAAQTITKDPAIKSNIRKAADILVKSNADVREFAARNGIEIKDLEGYMAHFATKEAQKFLKESGQTVSSGAAKIGGDERVLTRKINENITNTNTLMKKKTGVDEFFTPDAFIASAGGQHRTINYIVAEMAKDQVVKNPDLARVIPSGSKPRKGFVAHEINGKKYEMTKGALETIKRYESAVTDDNMKKFLKTYDKAMNMWKKGALFSLGYHARNVLGNSFNMWVSGMNPASLMAKQTMSIKYLSALKSFRSGGKETLKGVPEKVAKQYDEFVSTGLRATGLGADFADDAAEKAMSEVAYRSRGSLGKGIHEVAEAFKADGILGKGKALVNAPFEQSRRFGDEADEIARFTLYRHLRDKGMSVEKATNRVKEVLYDYNDLTTTEREIFKRFAPFYTFTRKNVEFQVKNMLQNPAKYNRLNMAIQEGYKNTDMNEDIVPEYLKESFALPIAGTNKLLNAGLPAADLARMTNPLKMGVDMLSPALKTPIELVTNRKMFNDAPIEEYQGQGGNIGVGGLDIPVGKKTEYALQSIFTPLRNLAGAQQQMDEGKPGLLKAIGGQMTKDYDEESFQTQADYRENERLQGIKKKMEKEEGKEVMTLKDMKDQGIPTNDEEKAEKELFDKFEYSSIQRATLLKLKKKVEKGDPRVAAQARAVLEQNNLPEEIIEYVLNTN